MNLFLDTTQGFTIGLFKEGRWLEYTQQFDQKSSRLLHPQLYQLLKKQNSELNKIDVVFQVAGPGSYTGVRLGEGITQLLAWQGSKVYSFYHFEVPALLNENSLYLFISKAFKGEYFLYDSKSQKSQLLTHQGAQQKITEASCSIYTYDSSLWKSDFAMTTVEFLNTRELLAKFADELFTKVRDRKLKREIFYYRPLEEEFKVSL